MSSRFMSEFMGTAGLLIVIVGSGVMAESLFQGNSGLALLANSVATGAGLYVLINVFSPYSGAHFNPIVSLIESLTGHLSKTDLFKFILAQILGAMFGVLVTHAMFSQSLIQISIKNREGVQFILSEVVASFGLLIVIVLSQKNRSQNIAKVVALYILAAYWCTSSTSFANPVVTLARGLTNTFTGIGWRAIPGFIMAQIVGALLAFYLQKFISTKPRS